MTTANLTTADAFLATVQAWAGDLRPAMLASLIDDVDACPELLLGWANQDDAQEMETAQTLLWMLATGAAILSPRPHALPSVAP